MTKVKINTTTNKVNVSTTENKLTITNNNTGTSVNISPTNTGTVTVSAPGPKGTSGAAGNDGQDGADGTLTSNSGFVSSGSGYFSGSNAHITASGNISSSGTIYMMTASIGGGIFTSASLANTVSSFTELTDIPFLYSSSLQTLTDVTASGNISSSGIITAEGLVISDDAEITDTLTMGGHLYIPDSIVHAQDTNTKMRFPEVDTIAFNTSGVERLRINALGGITASGELTIGNNEKLYLNKSEDTYVQSMAGDIARVVAGGNQMLILDYDTGNRAVFGNGTKVYIGANNNAIPTDELEVAGNISTTGHISASGHISSSGKVFAADGFYHSKDVDQETYIGFPTGDKIYAVAGGVNFIYAWQKDADVNKLIFNEDNTDTDIVFRSANGSNNKLLYLDASADKIGIKTGLPTEALTVEGNISASGNFIGLQSASFGGANSSSATLTVAGTISASGDIRITGDIFAEEGRFDNDVWIGPGQVGDDTSPRLRFHNPNTDAIYVDWEGGPLHYRYDTSTKVSFTAEGNISASAEMVAKTGSFNALSNFPYMMNVGWVPASGLGRYIPMTGNINEQNTPSSNGPEYTTFVIPRNGTLKEIHLCYESQTTGTTTVRSHFAGDGADPSTTPTETVELDAVAADTVQIAYFSSSLVRGQKMAIYVDPGHSSTSACNAMIMMEFDMTS